MNMMNKCAKFHKDSLRGKKVKFNLVSVIELSETADFVYNFVYGNLKNSNAEKQQRELCHQVVDPQEISGLQQCSEEMRPLFGWKACHCAGWLGQVP